MRSLNIIRELFFTINYKIFTNITFNAKTIKFNIKAYIR